MEVTTSARAGAAGAARAEALAATWGLRLVARGAEDRSRPHLVMTRAGLRLRCAGGEAGWHPGLLHVLRDAGAAHPIVRLAGLEPGDRVLDATLGLGVEAAFLAEFTGTRVLGVEAVAGLAALAAEGLAAAGHAVDVVRGDSLEVLRAQGTGSFALVYADPLFPPGAGVAPGLAALRAAGAAAPLGEAWLAEARRVAGKAVVMKGLQGDDALARLGAREVAGRRRARYGVWGPAGRGRELRSAPGPRAASR